MARQSAEGEQLNVERNKTHCPDVGIYVASEIRQRQSGSSMYGITYRIWWRTVFHNKSNVRVPLWYTKVRGLEETTTLLLLNEWRQYVYHNLVDYIWQLLVAYKQVRESGLSTTFLRLYEEIHFSKYHYVSEINHYSRTEKRLSELFLLPNCHAARIIYCRLARVRALLFLNVQEADTSPSCLFHTHRSIQHYVKQLESVISLLMEQFESRLDLKLETSSRHSVNFFAC